MPSGKDNGDALLEARGLIKAYDGRRVVDELDLTLHKQSVLGLLGPNGAGKTTCLRMLYGFIEPEGGSIRVDGLDFKAHRTRVKRWIGVCTQEDTLDYDFSVRENLAVYANYFRPRVDNLSERVEELIDRFGLQRYADMSPHALSGGFKRRLMIARSVVHQPRILFLDEPTTGLDPRARVDVWALIDQLRSEGMAIILTTHYMDEAERLSDQLLVLSEGRSLAAGSPGDIMGALLGEHVVVVAAEAEDREEVTDWLAQHNGTRPSKVLSEIHVPLSSAELAAFSERFQDLPFQVRSPNLDDLFLRLSED